MSIYFRPRDVSEDLAHLTHYTTRTSKRRKKTAYVMVGIAMVLGVGCLI